MFSILPKKDFMILSGKKIVLFVTLFMLLKAGSSQDLFNVENSKRFANYLMNTRQYHLAAIEYERILNISVADDETGRNLLKAYRFDNNCTQSFQNLSTLNIDNFLKTGVVAREFLNLSLACNCNVPAGDFERALLPLNANSQAFYRLGYYFFRSEHDSLFRFKSANKDLIAHSYPSLLFAVEELENSRRLSPGLAAGMSAVLPGSGKAYSGYWGDALMSLAFVGTNAWLSYRGFDKKGVKSASGWAFGGLSLGFYLGNIWGSARAARTRNEIRYEKLYNEAKNSFYSHF
jgi:hypothetical protein